MNTVVIENNPKRCLEPVNSGGCKKELIDFRFDPKSKSCKEFTWGGCKGSGNRFKSEAECEVTCWQFLKKNAFKKIKREAGMLDIMSSVVSNVMPKSDKEASQYPAFRAKANRKYVDDGQEENKKLH